MSDTPLAPPLAPSLWDYWRETGEAHGYPQPLTPHGGSVREHVTTIRSLVRDDDELVAALDAWWASPLPKADQRRLGHFAGHLPSVLKHLRDGVPGPWGGAPRAGLRSHAALATCAHGHTPPCLTLADCTRRWLDEERVRQGLPPRAQTGGAP